MNEDKVCFDLGELMALGDRVRRSVERIGSRNFWESDRELMAEMSMSPFNGDRWIVRKERFGRYRIYNIATKQFWQRGAWATREEGFAVIKCEKLNNLARTVTNCTTAQDQPVGGTSDE